MDRPRVLFFQNEREGLGHSPVSASFKAEETLNKQGGRGPSIGGLGFGGLWRLLDLPARDCACGSQPERIGITPSSSIRSIRGSKL